MCGDANSNVLVRQHPNGRAGQHQVVLIDHGLYVKLTPEFRHTYSQLWYAIFIQDMPTIRRICEGWGIGHPELFASATLLKPWRAKKTKNNDAAPSPSAAVHEAVDTRTSEERMLQAQRELKATLRTFLLNAELLPKELIFVGRAMRILQANNQAMGLSFLFFLVANVFFLLTKKNVCFRLGCQPAEHPGSTCVGWAVAECPIERLAYRHACARHLCLLCAFPNHAVCYRCCVQSDTLGGMGADGGTGGAEGVWTG